MRKFLITLLSFCVYSLPLWLSAQQITNVHFFQIGQDIQINYTLKRLSFDTYMLIECFVSCNGGNSFEGPLQRIHGDIGKVATSGEKIIHWKVSDEMKDFGGQIVFEIRGEVVKQKLKAENLLVYNVSGSSFAGLMYGRVARWGGYIRGKTNLSTEDAPYSCDDAGHFDYTGDDYYTVDGKSRRSRLGITAGVLYRMTRPVYLYAGAGYGYRRLMWHAITYSYDDDSQTGDLWAVNTNHSAEGIEVEAGGIIRYKRLALSAGVNMISFSFFEVNAAIGVFF